MNLQSFRFRIALLSAVLAGSALVGFGLVAWRLIYVAKVSRLDARLESQVKRAIRPRLPDEWQSFEASLASELGTEPNTPITLQVINEDGQTLYQSESWLADLAVRLPPSAQPAFGPPTAPPFARRFERSFERPEAPFDRNSPGRPSDRPNRISTSSLPNPRIFTRSSSVGSWRVGALRVSTAQSTIAVSLHAIDQEMLVIRSIFLIVIPGTLLLIAGGAWALSGSALKPIRKLTTAIQQVTITGLNQQVPIGTTDVEFVELIQVFNQMLERLERSFKQASRFSGDAAHELKTPLAILQGELERTLQQAEPGSELQQRLSNLLDEVSRLNGIVRKLLLLSLADAGKMGLHQVPVNLSELLAINLEDVEMLAPQLELKADIPNGLWVWGDRDLLNQVLQNLISNAIKYNLPDGWIQIQAQQQAQQQAQIVQVTFTNASNPIPASEGDRIFDRFYRGDPARTRKVEGLGLGLSLSREIARAHNGDLVLGATFPGQTAFTLKLPPMNPAAPM